ncbi:hypothetical protein J2Z69_000931 [Paenibacillus shirakamiensis]|uniref:Uncharacterized protein n=1 Tax=Paenibacillus shirakamiensis TaxID=1265935 RepID=A0ABS4JDX6_9BACL|nr:hypothetical protein [Paenibacillus shirakamiensis]
MLIEYAIVPVSPYVLKLLRRMKNDILRLMR